MIKKLYHNRPQQLSKIIRANVEYWIIGRGGGKTKGIIAPRIIDLVHEMPRSKGVFLTPTFKGAQTNTLPPAIEYWNEAGYYEDIHYVIGKRPPKHFAKPLVPPLNWEHTISFYNGSCMVMVSQDRSGSSNGSSVDWVIVDEAKLINKERMDTELMPAVRGNRQHFGHLSSHHSILYVTDMPTGVMGKWILEKDKDVDPQLIYGIKTTYAEMRYYISEYKKKKTPDWKKKKIIREIKKLQFTLNAIRKKAVFYFEASAIDNIDILGREYFERQERDLPDLVFRTNILNKRLLKSENGFYSELSEAHLYTDYSDTGMGNIGIGLKKKPSFDCRDDHDLQPVPLILASDPGARINTLVIAQPYGSDIKIINGMHVNGPLKVKHLVKKFTEYYRFVVDKKIVFYYDHTLITRHGVGDSYKDNWDKLLKRAGWEVTWAPLGATPDPEKRYQLWANTLDNSNADYPNIEFNKINCENLLISMQLAPVKEGLRGFKKDKSSERDANINDEDATDYSDAIDTLLWGYHYKPTSPGSGWMGTAAA